MSKINRFFSGGISCILLIFFCFGCSSKISDSSLSNEEVIKYVNDNLDNYYSSGRNIDQAKISIEKVLLFISRPEVQKVKVFKYDLLRLYLYIRLYIIAYIQNDTANKELLYNKIYSSDLVKKNKDKNLVNKMIIFCIDNDSKNNIKWIGDKDLLRKQITGMDATINDIKSQNK